MSYPPRIYVPDGSVHVFARGINGGAIAHDDDDAEHLCRALEKAAKKQGVRVHAYAVLTTHYHAIATPGDAGALGQMMEVANGSQTKYINRRYKRTGTIWNERYGDKTLQDEAYWYRCLRYVDLNPY